MVEVRASTEITASARAVWSVLTDLPRFTAWNPFIRAAEGSTDVGKTVRVRVRSWFGLPLVFHATVLDSDENRELHWVGHVLAPWLACGEHWFTIEPIDAHRVRFVQRERFSGVLPRLAARVLAREAKRGFEAMNQAIAKRAQLRSDDSEPDSARGRTSATTTH
jgi:hypothetical protein